MIEDGEDLLEDVQGLMQGIVGDGEEYVRIHPALLAAHAVERAADEMRAAVGGKIDRWWFAISDAHQALTAALVEALSGSAGVGALIDADAKAWLKWYEASLDDPTMKCPREGYIARFEVLLKRAQDAERKSDMQGMLVLSAHQQEDLELLNQYRNALDHPKPGHWSLQTAGLPRILGAAAHALGQLFRMDSLRHALELDDWKRAEEAVKAMLWIAAERPSAL